MKSTTKSVLKAALTSFIVLFFLILAFLLVSFSIAPAQTPTPSITPKQNALLKLVHVETHLEAITLELEDLTAVVATLRAAIEALPSDSTPVPEPTPEPTPEPQPEPPPSVSFNTFINWDAPGRDTAGNLLPAGFLRSYEIYLAGPSPSTEYVLYEVFHPTTVLQRSLDVGNYSVFVVAVSTAGKKSAPTPTLSFTIPLTEPQLPPQPEPPPNVEHSHLLPPVLKWERDKLRWANVPTEALKIIIYIANTNEAKAIFDRRTDGTFPGSWSGAQRGIVYQAVVVDSAGKESVRSNAIQVP